MFCKNHVFPLALRSLNLLYVSAFYVLIFWGDLKRFPRTRPAPWPCLQARSFRTANSSSAAWGSRTSATLWPASSAVVARGFPCFCFFFFHLNFLSVNWICNWDFIIDSFCDLIFHGLSEETTNLIHKERSCFPLQNKRKFSPQQIVSNTAKNSIWTHLRIKTKSLWVLRCLRFFPIVPKILNHVCAAKVPMRCLNCERRGAVWNPELFGGVPSLNLKSIFSTLIERPPNDQRWELCCWILGHSSVGCHQSYLKRYLTWRPA